MFKHVLLPTDGSEVALRAIQAGVELAASLGADVTVMTALEHFTAIAPTTPAGPEALARHEREHAVALQRLDTAERVARAAGVRCHRMLMRERSVCRGILEAARTAGADLIVMGTHGVGRQDGPKGTSHTQRVLVHSGIPVLTMQ